jgi:hypothetical protein
VVEYAFFLPVDVLSIVSGAKFAEGLRNEYQVGKRHRCRVGSPSVPAKRPFQRKRAPRGKS